MIADSSLLNDPLYAPRARKNHRSGRIGSWIIESGRYRIAIAEEGTTAKVLTVIRLRGKR